VPGYTVKTLPFNIRYTKSELVEGLPWESDNQIRKLPLAFETSSQASIAAQSSSWKHLMEQLLFPYRSILERRKGLDRVSRLRVNVAE
jgi:hypothetical protein